MTVTMTPEEREAERLEIERATSVIPAESRPQPRPRPGAHERHLERDGDPAPIGGDVESLREVLEGIPTEVRHRREAELVEASIEKAEAERTERLADRLALIPPRHQAVRLTRPELVVWVESFLAGEEVKGLLFVGPTGRGKTGMMWAVYRAIVEADYRGSVEFRKVVGLLRSLRPGNETESISRLIKADVLFLDDLGAHKGSEWVDQELYEIIDTRYDHCRPTIVSTNVVESAFYDTFGDRLGSRLKEQSFERVVFGGDDLRGPTAPRLKSSVRVSGVRGHDVPCRRRRPSGHLTAEQLERERNGAAQGRLL